MWRLRLENHIHVGELNELEAKEEELNIRPDPEIEAFMKAAALKGKRTSIMTDVALKYLGLEASPSFCGPFPSFLGCCSPMVQTLVSL